LLASADDRVLVAVSDPDPIVAVRALEAVLRHSDARMRSEGLLRAARHRSAFVRRRSLAGGGRQVAEQLLLDANAWNREFARQAVGGDHAEFYRAALNDSSRVEGAIRGLMDVGNAADAPRIRPFLDAKVSRIANVALDALCKLSPSEAEAAVLAALSSSRAALARAAWRHVRYQRVRLLTSSLVTLATTGASSIRGRALGLLHRQDRWAALVLALESRSDRDPRVVRAATHVLSSWEHVPTALYAKPTDEQRRVLEALHADVPAKVARTLEIVLQPRVV
jgi:hypothetical protein